MPESDLLRVVACGSVDDGKSTLIGRLLYDTEQIPLDHLAIVIEDSKRIGTRGGSIDLALVTDGLAAEREQGITIDVAYRYFTTSRRRVILADTPGHEQYTRNMATGASTADAAIVLVDSRSGVLTQTRRHTHIVSLLGVRTVVLCVNKMDLVGFDEQRFRDIVADYEAFASNLGDLTVVPIPISALEGDNVATLSARTPWFDGEPLLGVLDQLDTTSPSVGGARLPVQLVLRPDDSFRGYAGRIAAGNIEVGDQVKIMPAGTTTTIGRIITMDPEGGDQDHEEAERGKSVTVTFSPPVDCSRGDLICSAEQPAGVADRFRVTLFWMSDEPMLAGRPYLMKIGTQTVGATCSALRHRIDVNSGEHTAANVLELNDIGVCNIATDRPIAFDSYLECASTGGFILIDRYTSGTIAAGMIEHPLRRSDNIHPHVTTIGPEQRSALKGHLPAVVWLTGLSGSGKSTIANALERRLNSLGVHTALLDGDSIRGGLNQDLGFTDVDRVENIRRVAEVSALMVDAGLVVITAFISPFRAERDLARSRAAPGAFFEVHIDVPLAEAERRDPKGLYAKARNGELPNFTGVDAPYEAPVNPEVRIDTSWMTVDEAVDLIHEALGSRQISQL